MRILKTFVSTVLEAYEVQRSNKSIFFDGTENVLFISPLSTAAKSKLEQSNSSSTSAVFDAGNIRAYTRSSYFDVHFSLICIHTHFPRLQYQWSSRRKQTFFFSVFCLRRNVSLQYHRMR